MVPACRLSVLSQSAEMMEPWLGWINSDRIQVLEEAGKGEVYVWRRY